ncbi:MAG TPA: hypothetical protein VKT78_09890 [Fimbriimonadaceae bacterium]|nr:hypothetical protein [Fimbriimonadaceae bacterium]
MLRIVDWMRRTAVYTITYVLGFLAALTVIAAATQPETGAWLPISLGFLFFALLGLLPPFKLVELRLALTGVMTSGSLAAWFISEPPAASEPHRRLAILVPILCATGPALCLLLLALLWEQRRTVSRSVWNWLSLLVAMSWLVSYYSASHNIDGVTILPHGNFRFDSDVARAHSLAHRGLLQVLCFGSAALASVGLATASRATRPATVAVGLLFPSALALFDEGRYRIEFAEHFAKRSLAIDAIVILAAFAVSMAATMVSQSFTARRQASPG